MTTPTTIALLEYALGRDPLARGEDAAAKARRASCFDELTTALRSVAGKSLATRAKAIEDCGTNYTDVIH